jgi:tRNA threonylcarbamoyladenosine biosynthesis protein TsaB
MHQENTLRSLVIETSGRVGHIAVAQGGIVCSSQLLQEGQRHARDLAPTVRSLLSDQGWKPKSIEAVIVSRGPGSYTGLRVGIMSAKAFAYATGCRLIAVDTFQAIAQRAPADADMVEVVADAQQDRVYCQRFRRKDSAENWETIRELKIEALSTWLDRLDRGLLVTGPGLRTYGQRLPGALSLAAPEIWDATPEAILRVAYPRVQGGSADEMWTLEPLYLRPSSAEEKWQARVERETRAGG